MKSLLTLLLFFSFTSSLLYADTEPNSTCADEEIITALHGTTLQVTHSVSGEVKNNVDEFDYYTFEPAGSGKLVISYTSDANTNFAVTAVSGCSTNTNTLLVDGQSLADTVITVQSGKAVHIRVDYVNNNTNYTISMVWTPDAIASGNITTPNDCNTTGASIGERDFCRRSNLIANGGMVTIGNTVLVPPDPNTQDCSAYSDGDFIANFNGNNSGLNLCSYQGLPGLNATSATLSLPDPSNSEILYAGLYWQSLVLEADLSDVTGMSVHIQNQDSTGAGAGLKAVTVDKLDYELDIGEDGYYSYSAYSNVTSIFNTGTYNWVDGNITVEGIPSYQGSISGMGNYGAWTLVVVYKDPNQALKNFSIFDGWKTVKDDASNNDVEIGIKGFRTPKSGVINASVSMFVAEGDREFTADKLTIIDELTGAEVILGDQDSSIDNVPIRTPFLINNNGIDIHTYEVGNHLQNEQSFVRFHFKNIPTDDVDYHWPSMIAFETDIYEPSLCYDYAYSQNGAFFTNDNNGTEQPRIQGDPIQSANLIDVSIYVRNLEDSDVDARNVFLDITDINTTQAVYSAESVSLTYPNSILPTAIPDSDLVVADDFIKDMDIGTISGNDAFFAHYKLEPSTTDIDIPINAELRYDLVFSDGTTTPFRSILGGEKLPMCSGASSVYNPTWSIFDIVDANLYSAGNKKYNIPTQVTRRPGAFNLVSFEPLDLITHKPVNTGVAVELIDAGAYHVTSASCSESSSAISGKVWVTFADDIIDGDPSDLETLDITAAIANGLVTQHPDYPMTSAEDFYSVARKNAAFRISYNVTKDDENLIQLSGGDDAWQIANYVELVQDIGECSSPVLFNIANTNTTTNVATACSNAGVGSGSAMSNWQLARCQECIYGYRTKFVCSRDNFAIRPEALDFKIFDRPSGGTPELELAKTSNSAVGYNYHFDITATSHDSNLPTKGYTQYYNGGTDANLTFKWSPNGRDVSGCLNTENHSPYIYMNDGLDVNADGNSSTLGRFEVGIIDRDWTKVDVNPFHHSGINPLTGINNSLYFEPDDCISDSGDVPLFTSDYNNNKVGCDLKSSHTNINTVTVFQDYNLTVRPYEYRVFSASENSNSLWITKGSSDQNITGNDYVYMNNIQTELGANILPEDLGMSMRYRAFIRPVGADNNNSLPNFVNNCYAEPLELNTTLIIPASTQNFRRRALTSSSNDLSSITAVNSTSDTTNVITVSSPVNILSSAFTPTNPGTIALELDYNYDRERNTSVNPLKVTFGNSTLACSNPIDCTRIANAVDESPETNFIYDANISYIYGRVHIPRHRSATPTALIPIYYEFYCDAPTGCVIGDHAADPAISPDSLLSPDDVRWYAQTLHNLVVDGNATSTRTRNGNDDGLFAAMDINNLGAQATYTYDGTQDYPYKVTMEINASNWLLYNRYNANSTANNFELEFTQAGNWAGLDNSGMEADSNASSTTNRRIQW